MSDFQDKLKAEIQIEEEKHPKGSKFMICLCKEKCCLVNDK